MGGYFQNTGLLSSPKEGIVDYRLALIRVSGPQKQATVGAFAAIRGDGKARRCRRLALSGLRFKGPD